MENLNEINNKPKIQINHAKIEDIMDESLSALIGSNHPPIIFIMGGRLVRLRQDEFGKPIIENINDDILRYELERAAEYYQRKTEGDIPHAPPALVIKDILAMGQWQGIPILAGVVEAPIIKPTGNILDKPGYDPETMLFYQPSPQLDIPEIPSLPTMLNVEDAKVILREPLRDFPFSEKADLTNMLALLITPFIRPALNGPVPLALVSAPQPGSGKTLLGEICGLVATGHSPTMLQFSPSEEENRKKITSALLQGDSVIEYDNVKLKVDSGVLASALTGNEWGDRILGRSQNVRLAQRATWIMNGNNLQIGDELNRRSFPINLLPNESHPWLRQDFSHDNLTQWVRENRGRLIWAILVLIRHWVISGKPRFTSIALGNFNDWAETVGGIIVNAGIPNFLENLDEMYETQGEEEWQWEYFLSHLNDEFGDKWFTTKEVSQLIADNQNLVYDLPTEIVECWDEQQGNTSSQNRKIGRALRSIINRRFGTKGIFLENERDKHKKVAIWRISCGDAGYCGISDSEKN